MPSWLPSCATVPYWHYCQTPLPDPRFTFTEIHDFVQKLLNLLVNVNHQKQRWHSRMSFFLHQLSVGEKEWRYSFSSTIWNIYICFSIKLTLVSNRILPKIETCSVKNSKNNIKDWNIHMLNETLSSWFSLASTGRSDLENESLKWAPQINWTKPTTFKLHRNVLTSPTNVVTPSDSLTQTFLFSPLT